MHADTPMFCCCTLNSVVCAVVRFCTLIPLLYSCCKTRLHALLHRVVCCLLRAYDSARCSSCCLLLTTSRTGSQFRCTEHDPDLFTQTIPLKPDPRAHCMICCTSLLLFCSYASFQTFVDPAPPGRPQFVESKLQVCRGLATPPYP